MLKKLSILRVAVAMFLDIEAAFNNATFGSMRDVLVEKGVIMPLTEWIYNSLKTRVATAQQGSFRAEKRITKGCPQGGILSLYLWNLIMEDLLNMFPELHSTFVIVYADDVLLLSEEFEFSSSWHLLSLKFFMDLCDVDRLTTT